MTPPATFPALFPEVEPWPESVNGDDLLNDLSNYFSRFCYLPAHAAGTMAAWTVATWLLDSLPFAPLLGLLSPTKRAGKTLLLDLLKPVVCRGLLTSGPGVTLATLFRVNELHHPTLLLDEAERLKDDDRAELIGFLNAGYRTGGVVLRCQGERHDLKVFDAFGFRAVAAIGRLFDTLADRAILIPMTRKPHGVAVERFNGQRVNTEGADLARKICAWVPEHREAVELALLIAPRPDYLHDRAADSWGPLFAVGMAAQGGWIARLKDAARALSAEPDGNDRGEQLLRDVQSVFAETGAAELSSASMTDKLNVFEGGGPWGDLNGGRGLSAVGLARMLRPFGIKPQLFRLGAGPVRGYRLNQFRDAFARYLTPEPADPPSESLQPLRNNESNGLSVTNEKSGVVTDQKAVVTPEPVTGAIAVTVTEGVTDGTVNDSTTSGNCNECNGSKGGTGTGPEGFASLDDAVKVALDLFGPDVRVIDGPKGSV